MSVRVFFALGVLGLLFCNVANGQDADERFNKEHKEMTDKLRAKHGMPAPPRGGDDRRDMRDDPRDRYDDRHDSGRYDDYYDRRDMRDRHDMDRGMPRHADRIPRPDPRLHDPRLHDDFRGSWDRDRHDRHERREPDVDRNIGATRTVTFKEQSLGLEISREWGHSHFLVDKVKGEAEALGVKVGEAVVAVNGEKTRWKNLAQVQEQVKKAGRPVEIKVGEHRPHGDWGRHHDL